MKKKYCWKAKRYIKGWRMGLVDGNDKIIWLPFWFKNQIECQMALDANIVFVHMAYEGYEGKGKNV